MTLFIIWLFSTFFWTTLMSFFSTQEMACISYNRLKLEAASRRGNFSATRIKYMLENPLLLFGTTLFGVNLCLVLGSESARQAFQSLGLNPTLSAIFHIPYVLVFGELVPMFAARLFPEHMARIGIPVLWFTSRLFQPFVRLFSSLFSSFQHFFRRKALSQPRTAVIQLDELQEVLQESINDSIAVQSNDATSDLYDGHAIDTVATRILSLREKPVQNYMLGIQECITILASKKLDQAAYWIMSEYLSRKEKEPDKASIEFVLLHNTQGKIVGAISSKDIFELSLTSSIKSETLQDIALPTCYITEETTLSDAFSRLKKERSTISLVMNPDGDISGVLPLHIILEELFPHQHRSFTMHEAFHLEKTTSGDEKVLEFLHKYGISPYSLHDPIAQELIRDHSITFSDLFENKLKRKPNKGEVIDIGPYIITVLEASLLGAKTVFITTKGH